MLTASLNDCQAHRAKTLSAEGSSAVSKHYLVLKEQTRDFISF